MTERRIRRSYDTMIWKMIKKGVLVSSFCFLVLWAAAVFAEDKAVSFNKDISYDIYYEVSNFEVDSVENAKILGTKAIEEITFLVVKASGLAGKDEKEGYILFNTIRAILPTKSIEPKRTFGDN